MLLPLFPYFEMTNPVVHDDRWEIYWYPRLQVIETEAVSKIHVVLPSRARSENVEEQILKDSAQRSEITASVELASFIVRSSKLTIDSPINHVRTNSHFPVGREHCSGVLAERRCSNRLLGDEILLISDGADDAILCLLGVELELVVSKHKPLISELSVGSPTGVGENIHQIHPLSRKEEISGVVRDRD